MDQSGKRHIHQETAQSRRRNSVGPTRCCIFQIALRARDRRTFGNLLSRNHRPPRACEYRYQSFEVGARTRYRRERFGAETVPCSGTQCRFSLSGACAAASVPSIDMADKRERFGPRKHDNAELLSFTIFDSDALNASRRLKSYQSRGFFNNFGLDRRQ